MRVSPLGARARGSHAHAKDASRVRHRSVRHAQLVMGAIALGLFAPEPAHAFVRFYTFNGTNGGAANYGDGAGATTPACTGFVDENNPASISCGASAGALQDVAFANYGTPTGTCGGYSSATSCNTGSNAGVVATQCVGRSACSFSANNTFFGDPCPGFPKQLAAQLTCAPDMGERSGSIALVSGRTSGGSTALSFGAGSSLTFDDGSVSGNDARTIAYWIKGASANETVYFSGSTASSYFASVIDAAGKPAISGSNGLSLTAAAALDSSTWTHVLMTYDPAGNTAIYINGALSAAATTSSLMGEGTLNTPSTFWLGASDSGADFTGQLDDVYLADAATVHPVSAEAIMNTQGTSYSTARAGGVPAPLTLAQIPTLSEWGMILMMVGLGLTMVRRMRAQGQA